MYPFSEPVLSCLYNPWDTYALQPTCAELDSPATVLTYIADAAGDDNTWANDGHDNGHDDAAAANDDGPSLTWKFAEVRALLAAGAAPGSGPAARGAAPAGMRRRRG